MTIFGIDPGYAIVGFGIVEYSANAFRTITYGAVSTDSKKIFYTRLSEIYDDISSLLDIYRPDAVAVEKLFFHTNQKTVIDVGQARGVIMLAVSQKGIPIYEYTPLQVKQAVVGYGRAEKQQVMEITKNLLHLNKLPTPDDAADALAIAICHAHSCGSKMFCKNQTS